MGRKKSRIVKMSRILEGKAKQQKRVDEREDQYNKWRKSRIVEGLVNRVEEEQNSRRESRWVEGRVKRIVAEYR